MITTIIVVVALTIAVIALIGVIANSGSPSDKVTFPPEHLLRTLVRSTVEETKGTPTLFEMKREYERGYNDAYSHASKLTFDEKYRTRSLDEQ